MNLVHVRKTLLRHTISKLILIEVGIYHMDDKTLPHDTIIFSVFELETIN